MVDCLASDSAQSLGGDSLDTIWTVGQWCGVRCVKWGSARVIRSPDISPGSAPAPGECQLITVITLMVHTHITPGLWLVTRTLASPLIGWDLHWTRCCHNMSQHICLCLFEQNDWIWIRLEIWCHNVWVTTFPRTFHHCTMGYNLHESYEPISIQRLGVSWVCPRWCELITS